MVVFIYDFLLAIMLYVLYKSGKEIAKTGKIWSSSGFAAILIYTLNEGLRYGRGVDYNLYGQSYERLAIGIENNWPTIYSFIAHFFIELGIPWQGMVMFMSFLFILGTLFMLKEYKEILPIALPIFALVSASDVENLLRWFTGFSFIMIGIYFLIRGNNSIKKYFLFCLLACCFHLALAPIPIAIFLIYKFKKPILNPFFSLSIFFIIALSFQTEFMMRFADLANTLTTISERFEAYSYRMDYWLTSGNDGIEKSALPDLQSLFFYIVTVILGYLVVKRTGDRYVFFYNLFLIGFLVYPISRQIELVYRFGAVFLFFRAVVVAIIIKYVYILKHIKLVPIAAVVSLLLIINIGRRSFTNPLNYPERYLYVWDSEGRTYDSMLNMWVDSTHDQYGN